MQKIILRSLLSAGLFFAALSGMADWRDEFAAPIVRLRDGVWEPHKMRESSFDRKADRLWTAIKRYRRDWEPLLEIVPKGQQNLDEGRSMSLEKVFRERDKFAKKPYIKKVIQSQKHTLVLETTSFPNLMLKLDARPGKFELPFRTYLEAFYNTNFIKKGFIFSHLFLPLEKGRYSKQIRARVVVSEKIPFFSSSELDNRILLHLLIQESNHDEVLAMRARRMYSQMIRYICAVNFGDINYRNVPFTIDGRLSPFDTDTLLADSGLNEFLEKYFAYRLFSDEELTKVVESHCSNIDDKVLKDNEEHKPIDQIREQLAVYLDPARKQYFDDMINQNDQIIATMEHFVTTRSNTYTNFKSLVDRKYIAKEDREYAKTLDRQINHDLKNPHATVIGTRCRHYLDLLREPLSTMKEKHRQRGDGIKEATVKAKLLELLQIAVDQNEMFAVAPIASLKNRQDVGTFICF